MSNIKTITWLEPVSYKWAVAETKYPIAQFAAFVGVSGILMLISAYHKSSFLFGWPSTIVVAIIAGFASAYLIPYLVRFGNRTCEIDESGIKCDELVAAKWRNRTWNWEEIQYCIIKRMDVRRKTFQVLLIRTTSEEEHTLGISNEVDLQSIESAILRAGCQLKNA